MAENSQSDAVAQTDVAAFRYTRLVDGEKRRFDRLADAMGGEDVATQTWLFVSPHDDDLCVGAGLLIQAAVEAGVDVRALIVTDGRMGYCTKAQKETIVDIRRSEAYQSFEILGVPRDQITSIAYPDDGLSQYQGRRLPLSGEASIEGYVGLQNAFTYYLRLFRPARVFVPSAADLHPDHQITHNELMISVFHAVGAIWPELGEPLATAPNVCELAVYCDFSESPNFELIGNQAALETKLRSIEAYQSQQQIATMVESARKTGAYEYMREVQFHLYSPETYKPMFR